MLIRGINFILSGNYKINKHCIFHFFPEKHNDPHKLERAMKNQPAQPFKEPCSCLWSSHIWKSLSDETASKHIRKTRRPDWHNDLNTGVDELSVSKDNNIIFEKWKSSLISSMPSNRQIWQRTKAKNLHSKYLNCIRLRFLWHRAHNCLTRTEPKGPFTLVVLQ